MAESKARARTRELFEMRTLEGQPYFHGLLPNKQAAMVLQEEGEFLLRYQDNDRTRSHGFVICLLHKSNLLSLKVHYNQEDRTYRLDEESKERTVKRLVERHWKKATPVMHGQGAAGKGAAGQGAAGQGAADKVRLELKTPVPRSRWELSAKDVQVGSKIGRGAFADVHKGVYTPSEFKLGKTSRTARTARSTQNTGQSSAGSQSQDTPPGGGERRRNVAVKQCRETSLSALVRFEKESHFQLQLRHPNIVETVGIITSPPRRMILLEYMAKGALDSYLKRHGGDWGSPELEKACLDAVRGMAYLHTLGIIHRDVAARNCLVSADYVVKIADFGLAKSMTVYKMVRGRIPVKWLAPESIRSGNFTAKSDVWSFGILCWEVFSKGKDPYPGYNNAEVKTKVAREKYRMEAPPDARPVIADAVRSCWEHDPDKRPSFKDLKHIFSLAVSASTTRLSSSNVASGPSMDSI